MMIWADHIQKSVFRHSGTLWLPRRFSARICFLLRAKFKKIISNINHDSKIYKRIAFGTFFHIERLFHHPQPAVPEWQTGCFQNVTREFCHQKSVTGGWLFDMLFLRHYYDQNKLKKCWYLPPFWICISFKKKVDHFLRSRQNITNSHFYRTRVWSCHSLPPSLPPV